MGLFDKMEKAIQDGDVEAVAAFYHPDFQMKMHSSGNLFATGPGGLLVISPEGKKLATIRLPYPVTNCYFDENEEYLYVTAFAYVARFKLKG